MKSALPLTVLALFAFVFAGCLDGAKSAVDPESMPHGHEAPMIALEGLTIEAKNCEQAGGNSVYPGQMGKLGPFDTADQRAEVGNPTIGAFGAPVTSPSSGIWHVTTNCKTYTYQGEEYQNFAMGWIAQMIQRPVFDTWGEPRIQFFVADLSFNNPDYAKLAQEATGGAEISPASENLIEWIVPQKYMHVTITEAGHGTFDFTAEIHKEFGKMQTQHIRFWMLPRADGMAHGHDEGAESAADPILYRPISIDIYDTATGGGVKLAGESAGTFTHFPDASNPAQNHVGNPLGHYWNGFDRTIKIGPMPEGITFDRTWLH